MLAHRQTTWIILWFPDGAKEPSGGSKESWTVWTLETAKVHVGGQTVGRSRATMRNAVQESHIIRLHCCTMESHDMTLQTSRPNNVS